MTELQRHKNRLYKQKSRGNKRSYLSELFELKIIFAYELGLLSEMQAVKRLNLSIVEFRELYHKTLAEIREQSK